jgi:hypothetical protein
MYIQSFIAGEQKSYYITLSHAAEPKIPSATNVNKTVVSVEEKVIDGATLNQQTLTIKSIGRQVYGSTQSMGSHSLLSPELKGYSE